MIDVPISLNTLLYIFTFLLPFLPQPSSPFYAFLRFRTLAFLPLMIMSHPDQFSRIIANFSCFFQETLADAFGNAGGA